MNILIPLGFLGLIGVLLIILIYILKPNYQQKLVSSTYIWKLSLKYKKKRIPINKLLNLILLLLQILVIVASSFILAKPVIMAEVPKDDNEKIAIIDASAGMRAEYNGETRFQRAVDKVYDLTEAVLKKDEGKMTVILAGKEAKYILNRSGSEDFTEALKEVGSLAKEDGEIQCTYGVADIDGAMALAEDILNKNPLAEVLLYSGTNYIDKHNVTLVDVAVHGDSENQGEWNAAILGVTPKIKENFYTFDVDVACYGKDAALTLNFEFYNTNDSTNTIKFSYPNILCTNNETVTLSVNPSELGDKKNLYSYKEARVYIEEKDSFDYDNEYNIYGGEPQELRIQYTSATVNKFFENALDSLRNTVNIRWKIDIKTVRADEVSQQIPETEGFDFYIFEGYVPEELPTDGVIFLVNPYDVPADCGITLGDYVKGKTFLTKDMPHPVTKGIRAEDINVTLYRRIALYDGYDTLLSCNDDPVLLVRNEKDSKIAMLALSLNYSDMAVVIQFPTMFFNMFNYYFPSPVTMENGTVSNVYEVDDSVVLNAMGQEMTVKKPDGEVIIVDKFPTNMSFEQRGTYLVKQRIISGYEIVNQVYVKTAASESNIFRVEDELPSIVYEEYKKEEDKDLLLYFAIALCALVFVEWMLHSKEDF